MNTDRMKKEHPRFELPEGVDLNALHPSFEDSSWHNDACPSFTSTELGLRLWIDYPPELSDMGDDFPRFGLSRIDEHEEWVSDVLATDDWQEVLNALAEV